MTGRLATVNIDTIRTASLAILSEEPLPPSPGPYELRVSSSEIGSLLELCEELGGMGHDTLRFQGEPSPENAGQKDSLSQLSSVGVRLLTIFPRTATTIPDGRDSHVARVDGGLVFESLSPKGGWEMWHYTDAGRLVKHKHNKSAEIRDDLVEETTLPVSWDTGPNSAHPAGRQREASPGRTTEATGGQQVRAAWFRVEWSGPVTWAVTCAVGVVLAAALATYIVSKKKGTPWDCETIPRSGATVVGDACCTASRDWYHNMPGCADGIVRTACHVTCSEGSVERHSIACVLPSSECGCGGARCLQLQKSDCSPDGPLFPYALPLATAVSAALAAASFAASGYARKWGVRVLFPACMELAIGGGASLAVLLESGSAGCSGRQSIQAGELVTVAGLAIVEIVSALIHVAVCLIQANRSVLTLRGMPCDFWEVPATQGVERLFQLLPGIAEGITLAMTSSRLTYSIGIVHYVRSMSGAAVTICVLGLVAIFGTDGGQPEVRRKQLQIIRLCVGLSDIVITAAVLPVSVLLALEPALDLLREATMWFSGSVACGWGFAIGADCTTLVEQYRDGKVSFDEYVAKCKENTVISYGRGCWSGGYRSAPGAIVLSKSLPGVSGHALWGHVVECAPTRRGVSVSHTPTPIVAARFLIGGGKNSCVEAYDTRVHQGQSPARRNQEVEEPEASRQMKCPAEGAERDPAAAALAHTQFSQVVTMRHEANPRAGACKVSPGSYCTGGGVKNTYRLSSRAVRRGFMSVRFPMAEFKVSGHAVYMLLPEEVKLWGFKRELVPVRLDELSNDECADAVSGKNTVVLGEEEQ